MLNDRFRQDKIESFVSLSINLIISNHNARFCLYCLLSIYAVALNMPFVKGQGRNMNFEFGALGCLRRLRRENPWKFPGRKLLPLPLPSPRTLPNPPLAKTPAHQTFYHFSDKKCYNLIFFK